MIFDKLREWTFNVSEKNSPWIKFNHAKDTCMEEWWRWSFDRVEKEMINSVYIYPPLRNFIKNSIDF